jgi:hypothetical protein
VVVDLSGLDPGAGVEAVVAGTPAFCCRPSIDRNSDQSGRSPIFKIGAFSTGSKLVSAAS